MLVNRRLRIGALVAVVLASSPGLALLGCDREEGPMEEAGEAVDDTMDDAMDDLDDEE